MRVGDCVDMTSGKLLRVVFTVLIFAWLACQRDLELF